MNVKGMSGYVLGLYFGSHTFVAHDSKSDSMEIQALLHVSPCRRPLYFAYSPAMRWRRDAELIPKLSESLYLKPTCNVDTF